MKKSPYTLTVSGIVIDTLPLFVQLAADTAAAYKDIDRLYAADPNRYHQLAAASPYAAHPLFTASSIDRQIYAGKFLGVLLAGTEDGFQSPLLLQAVSTVTKRWPKLCHYLSEAQTVDLAVVIQPCFLPASSHHNTGANLLTGAAARYIQSFIALFPVIDLPPQAALKLSLFFASLHRLPVTAADSFILDMLQALSTKLTATPQLLALTGRLDKASIKKTARYLKNIIFQKNFGNFYAPWQEDRMLEGLAHCNAYLSAQEGISLLSGQLMAQVRERDVELLCRLYLVKITAESMSASSPEKTPEEMELECAEFVMFGLNLLAFVREYKKAKKYFFAENTARLLAENSLLSQQLTSSQEEIRRLSAALARCQSLLQVREEEATAFHIREKFLLDIISQGEAAEAVAAAETSAAILLASAAPSPLPAAPDTASGISLARLSSLRGVIMGGTEAWQNKIKSKLPHFTYLNGDVPAFDEELLINADIIFANVRYKFSHDCFYKMIKIVRQHGKQLVFLTKTNLPLTLQQMVSALPPPASAEE